MTRDDAVKLVGLLFGTYGAADAGRQSVYVEMLEDLDLPVASTAVRELIATSKWLPQVAEIRAAVVEMVNPDYPSPDEAWDSVRRRGARAHPLAVKAAAICGIGQAFYWTPYGGSGRDVEPWEQHRYTKTYTGLVDADRAARMRMPGCRAALEAEPLSEPQPAVTPERAAAVAAIEAREAVRRRERAQLVVYLSPAQVEARRQAELAEAKRIAHERQPAGRTLQQQQDDLAKLIAKGL
jgi:hypothetical protein